MNRTGHRHILDRALSFFPFALILFLLVPVVSGFLGTLGPALGFLPALGGHAFSLVPFQTLFSEPGIGSSIVMSLASGLVTTFVSFLLVFLFVAAYADTRAFARVQRLMSPLLSIPHASAAFGLGFLLAPSGLIFRALSPWATGWSSPPDLQIINDVYGVTMVTGLVAKEVPFLFLMALAALPQIPVRQSRQIMTSLGYGKVQGFLLACGPLLYRQMRLPILAVLAFSTSVADVAMILGPQLPPTLAVRITQWMADPDLQQRFLGSAGAIVQVGVLLFAITLWGMGERLAKRLLMNAGMAGHRRQRDEAFRRVSFTLMIFVCALVFASLLALFLWSFAGLWPFPHVRPDSLSFSTWMRVIPQITTPFLTTVEIAFVSAGCSLFLALILLWGQNLHGRRQMDQWISSLIYLPLIVPQLAFVFGLQVLFLSAGFQPGLLALIAVHVVFVFPYIYLSLKSPWASLDPRYDQVSYSLGKSKVQTLLQVRLPLLIRPILTAFAVGLAVSIGLYLPTVLIGAGRLTTIATEAVALSSGGDRRVIGAYALVQTVLPFAGFFIASLLPALLEPRRSYQDIRIEPAS